MGIGKECPGKWVGMEVGGHNSAPSGQVDGTVARFQVVLHNPTPLTKSWESASKSGLGAGHERRTPSGRRKERSLVGERRRTYLDQGAGANERLIRMLPPGF